MSTCFYHAKQNNEYTQWEFEERLLLSRRGAAKCKTPFIIWLLFIGLSLSYVYGASASSSIMLDAVSQSAHRY